MMDIADVDPLSARSTSSLEDGASSARTKKSKTLARLRKLKKTEISPHDPTKDGLVPHPPDNQQRDVASDRRLSNGLVNGGSDLHDDFTTSTKLGQERINDFTTGADKGKVATLDPLPFNQPNWGEKQTLKSSLFSSPLDPVKPARRGLGGLEPLAPRAGLEPLEMPKPKSQVKPEESIDRVGIGTDGILKDETIEVNGEAKETFNTTAQREHVMSIGGAVETETSDSQDFSSDKDSFKVSNMETNLPAETCVEKESSIKSREQIKDVLVEPIEQLEDSDDDVLVSSAMKERTSIHSTFDDRTNNHTLTSNVPVNNRFLSSFGSDDKDALQVERTKSKTSVTLVEEDDESDDELIVVSPLPSSSKPQTMNVPQNNSEQQMDDDRGEKWKEDDLPNRTGLSKSDDEDDLVEHDSKEDEENLKQYLQNKLQHIEDDEDSDALIPASPSTPSRSGRLSPITNASAPPPLPNTIMSPALRTMYKRDDDLEDSFGTSEISDAVMSGGSFSETNRSMASSSLLLNALTNKSARKGNRSYLSGGVRNTGSLVGKDELDSHLPERRLRIFVATWNMHEDKEIPENLDDLLLPDDIEYMQDVYVIGTQESSPDIAEWEIRLQETLGPSHVLLHSASHGVLHCLVFIRRDLIWFCSPVEESRVSTRPGSMIKTKGAIAVSFNFFGTSFIFIVSHFTSGDENMKERLLDYEKILKGISLPDKVPPTRKFNILTSDVTSRFDCVFWCGDFNFRLAENKARVEGWIDQLKRGNKDDYDILLQHDQLNKAMQRDEIFQGFHEGKIGFLPTYKFDIGEDVYDTSPKARVPSYTDRVLYKSRKVSDISLIHYSSCEEIRTSDHRPVYGVFEAGIRPGKDNSLMGGGMFVRPVYIEGIKRRVAKSGMSKRTQSASAVCSVM